jgi:tRNA-dihydrouridine synthase
MQDICTPGFMEAVASRGAPDWFVTEFFRVHETSTLSPEILQCARVTATTGVPVYAQLIGENIPRLAAAATELSRRGFAGVDLNLGCPAPKVFRKNVGGGLLRDLPRVDAILDALRAVLPGSPLTVKTRISFDDTSRQDTLPALLSLINRHAIDFLALHGRTVRGLYRSPVDHAAIAEAVRTARCPVAANGEISSAPRAAAVLAQTRCAALMCGRHVVRNPWLFRQIREHLANAPVFQPTFGDVRLYIEELASITALTRSAAPDPAESSARHAARMKKFLNFVGTGVDPRGQFLNEARRAPDMDTLRRVCDRHLLDGSRAAEPYPAEPYPDLLARPNCEACP